MKPNQTNTNSKNINFLLQIHSQYKIQVSINCTKRERKLQLPC